MATITGIRVDQMGQLALMSTGSLFYVVSAAGNSYRMYEKDLYNSLYALHLSGFFQPKAEDWRFVHMSGNETITGNKSFVGDITGGNIYARVLYGFDAGSNVTNLQYDLWNRIIYDPPNVFINIPQRGFVDDNGITGIINRSLTRQLVDDLGSVALDWKSRTLVGSWTIPSSNSISGQIVTTGNRAVMTTGIQNISGTKTFYGDVVFYNPTYGANYLKFTSGAGGYLNFSDNAGVESINTTARTLSDPVGNIVINWANHVLLGATTYSPPYGFPGGLAPYSLNWDAGIMSGDWTLQDSMGKTCLDGGYRCLTDKNASTTVDWGNTFSLKSYNLRDSANTVCMWWGVRQLVDADGSTITLDWDNLGLSGIWTMNNQKIVTGTNVVYTTGSQNIPGTKSFSDINITGTTSMFFGSDIDAGLSQRYIPIGGTNAANGSGFLLINTPSAGKFVNIIAKVVRTNIGNDNITWTGNSFFHKEASFIKTVPSSLATKISSTSVLASHATGQSANIDFYTSGASIILLCSGVDQGNWTGMAEVFTTFLDSNA